MSSTSIALLNDVINLLGDGERRVHTWPRVAGQELGVRANVPRALRAH